MDYFSAGVLLFGVALAAGCAGRGPLSEGAEAPASQETEKQVLALQAFLDQESLQTIQAAWNGAIATDGIQCAGTHGMQPHMTFGSWKVTPDELEQAIARARELNGRLPGRRVRVEPRVDERDGVRSFFYVPPEDPGLHDYHRMAHERLAFPFEPFRAIDLTGQWQPHVTMFSGEAGAREPMDELIEFASTLEEVEIVAFGLVLFGPTRTAYAIQCAPPDEQD